MSAMMILVNFVYFKSDPDSGVRFAHGSRGLAAEQLARMRGVVTRLIAQQLSRAFGSWMAVRERGQRTLNIVKMAVAGYTSRYLRAGLRAWWHSSWLVKKERKTLHAWQ